MREYSGQYTLSDYLLANRMHLFSSRTTKFVIVFILLLMALPVLGLIGNPTDVFAWGLILSGLVIIAYPYTVLPIAGRIMYAQQPQIRGQVRILIGPDRIVDASATGSATHLWLHHILVSQRMILLFETPRTFIMLPRRFFKDEDDLQAAKSLLEGFPTGKHGYDAISRVSAPASLPAGQSPPILNLEGSTEDTATVKSAVSWPAQPLTQSSFEKTALSVIKIVGAIAGFLLALAGLLVTASTCLYIAGGSYDGSLVSNLFGMVLFGIAPAATGLALIVLSLRSLSTGQRHGTAARSGDATPSVLSEGQTSPGFDAKEESDDSVPLNTPLSVTAGSGTRPVVSRFENGVNKGAKILGIIAASLVALLLIFVMIAVTINRLS
ncbi:MAG: YcxB family protein [Dehalococcoidia bacterium]|nr:YcxB family protein [Dehalococcoidia bacterium]